MFLEEYGGKNPITKFEYTPLLRYWRNVLFEYSMKIFTWNNLPESIPAREIESRLYMYGKCGIAMVKGVARAVDCNLNGVTDYYDVFENFDWNTPLHSGRCVIGVDGILIRNNSLQESIFHKINYYSTLLAHTCLTYVSGVVNGRVNTIVECMTTSGAGSAQMLLRDIYNGKFAKIVNKGYSEMRFTSVNGDVKPTEYTSLYSGIGDILADFLTEIGVKKANEKKERMLVDEVKSNNNLLLLNMKDLFDSRKEGAEAMNKLFGWNVSVECNIDIDADGIEEVSENGNIAAIQGKNRNSQMD